MKSRSLMVMFLISLCLLVFSGCTKESPDKKAFVIGINQFMQHPLLDDVNKGLNEALKTAGISQEVGSQIIVKNANGDQNVALQINKQFIDQKIDVLVALGTPAAQSATKLTKTIPIVFGAITDPVAAGIADSIEKPGGNKTGTTDRWPYEKQIALIKKLVPKAKKVGIVLNPGESNTEASMKYIRPLIQKDGMETVEVPVANTAEVYNAVKSLVGRCDVLLVPGDNTVIAAMDSMVKVANKNKIPLFAGSTDMVEKGAIATYGNNYYEIGRETGKIIVDILKNKKNPGSIPVMVASDADLVINVNAAKAQGVTIPDDLLKAAKQVFK